VQQLVGCHIAARMWVMTFHSACGRMLRRDAELIGYRPSFTIYDQADQVRLVRNILEEQGKDPKRFTPRSIHSAISRAKDRLLTPELYSETIGGFFEQTVAEVYDDYERRLQAANHAQFRLVSLLSAGHRNPAVVGDQDQSIYAFRGADIRNISEFDQDFPDAYVVRLEQNYRSTQTILDSANAVIAHNRGRAPKQLWSDLGSGDPVRVIEAEDEHAEARFVAGAIQDAMDGGMSAADVAVFYRMNAQSRVLEDLLTRQGVDYRVIGGPKFYDRAEIKDAVAYLQVIENPAG